MSDITDSDEALEKDVQKLTIAVSSLSQAKGDARRRKIEVCDNLLEVVQEAVEEMAEGEMEAKTHSHTRARQRRAKVKGETT